MRVCLYWLCSLVLILSGCGGGGGGGSSSDGPVAPITPSNPIPINNAPKASVSPVQTVVAGALVNLSGISSSDADGDSLTYSWVLTAAPTGSAASLTGANTATPTFTADLAGTYVASLQVSDGHVTSTSATATITAIVGNAAPIANAGGAQDGVVGTPVTLSGGMSSDANGDALTYRWTIESKPAGSSAKLNDPGATYPVFTPDISGSYVVALVVNDGKADSEQSLVRISATMANAAPNASAGASRMVSIGTVVTLDGSGSWDANGDPLAFTWTLVSKPAGSTASLVDSAKSIAKFKADVSGAYVISLVVGDGKLSSSPAVTSVAASDPRDFSSLAIGQYNNIAIRPDRTVWTWGADSTVGMLGYPSEQMSPIPRQVPGVANAVAVAGGQNHFAVLTANGTVIAWGANYFGQLGIGAATGTETSHPPTAIPNFSGVKQIASGAVFMLALKSDGTVFAWGTNEVGTLGDGTTTPKATPTLVPGLSDIIQIAASSSYAMALRSDGSVFAWGRPAETLDTIWLTPRLVQGLPPVGRLIQGSSPTMVLAMDGSLWAWGDNHYGELGDGTKNASATPLKVNGISNVVHAATGGNVVLAVKADGTAYGWGANAICGAVGDGSMKAQGAPVHLSALSGVTGVFPDGDHSFAVKADGSLWGWGCTISASFGFVGSVQDKYRLTPERILVGFNIWQR